MTDKFIDHFFTDKWDNIIDSLRLQNGDRRAFGETFFKNIDGRFDKNIQKLIDAGYDKVDSVEWINYYPNKHFDLEPILEFEKYVNLKCARAWISKIRPGKMAPMHQDVDDDLEKYLEQGNLIRYSIFISKPCPGAVFLFNDSVHYLEPQGSVIKWNHYLDWHAGANCGFDDKFMFHFLGISNE